MTKTEFIQLFATPIIESTQGTGLLPSVKMAQAALETGWGKAFIGEANNLFGIKAAGKYTPYWKGKAVYSMTKEFVNGTYVDKKLAFRAYNSVADSIRDHSHLLTILSIYKPVLQATTYQEQARALKAAGYATDPGYADKLISIIEQNNFQELDKKKTA